MVVRPHNGILLSNKRTAAGAGRGGVGGSQMHMLSKKLSLKEYTLYDSDAHTRHSVKGKTIGTENRAVIKGHRNSVCGGGDCMTMYLLELSHYIPQGWSLWYLLLYLNKLYLTRISPPTKDTMASAMHFKWKNFATSITDDDQVFIYLLRVIIYELNKREASYFKGVLAKLC